MKSDQEMAKMMEAAFDAVAPVTQQEYDDLVAEVERLRAEMPTMHRSVAHECCVDVIDLRAEVVLLRAAMKDAADVLGARPGCIEVQIADDLRAALGEDR